MEKFYKGVYIHTPFCLQKCLYCDFPSYANYGAEVQHSYIDALCKELANVNKLEQTFFAESGLTNPLTIAENATIYFGGGTPTILDIAAITKVVEVLKANNIWQNPAEATIEANPGTVDLDKLKKLRELGFDRISFGVQSLQDNELKALGRIHTAAEALEAIKLAKQAGFERINADLMYGIIGQTKESFAKTLKAILEENLEHLSVYGLIVEEGTPFYDMLERDALALPEENETLEMYELTQRLLPEYGYNRYEISNYAKPGGESRHNLVYWRYLPYLAFGAGACSFNGAARKTNSLDVTEYITSPLETAILEKLSLDIQKEEYIFMGLRAAEGIDLLDAKKRYNLDVEKEYKEELEDFLKEEYLVIKHGRMALTEKGMRFGNQIFEKFIKI